MGKPVVIAVVGDNSGLKKSLNDSEGRLNRFGGTARKVGLAAAGGLAVGVGLAGKALFDMGKNAAADLAAQRRLAVALHNTAGATKADVKQVENWISKMGVATGVTDDEMRPALQRLVQSTGNIGKAQKLMSLALDASAGSGKSLETVTTALAKANSGNLGALSRLGVRIKDTEGKTLSFTQVTKQMADTFHGQAAAKADSLEGKMARLSLIFDETKESIGARLLPVATKLADWFLRDGLPAIQRFGGWFSKNLLPPLRELGEKVMSGLKGDFKQFKSALSDARPALELYGNYFKNVLLPVLKRAASVILPAIGLALRVTGKALGALGTIATFTWNKVLAPVFRFFANAVSKVLGGLGKMFSALGHVPGMGWAKRAGKDLQTAAAAASDLADGIKAIPDKKSVKFSLVLSPRDRAILENKNNAFVSSVLNASPRVSTTTTTSGQSTAPRIAPTVLVPGTTAAAPTVNITVQVPVGASGVDIGREIAGYLDQYFAIGGKRP